MMNEFIHDIRIDLITKNKDPSKTKYNNFYFMKTYNV